MLLHAATENARAAVTMAGVRDMGRSGLRDRASVCMQREHVEVPGRMIDVEAMVNEVATIAIINLGPREVGKAHLFGAQIRPWKQ